MFCGSEDDAYMWDNFVVHYLGVASASDVDEGAQLGADRAL